MPKFYLTRRGFISKSTHLASGFFLTTSLPLISCGSKNPVLKTKVGIIQSQSLWVNDRINQVILINMLNEGITYCTGYNDPSKAWNSLFNRNDVVALKVNCIGKEPGSTKPELSYSISECLKLYVGIPYKNIIIFDRYEQELIKAGYSINQSSKGIQIYPTPDYSPPIQSGVIPMGLSTIITNRCTALINVPLLKTHTGSKLTLNLKNHYGSIPTDIVQSNKLRFHAKNYENIVLVNSLPPLKEKTRLCIADGIIAQYDQGPMADPNFQWKFNGIIMGQDPVAVDSIGLKVINEKRIEKNLQSFKVKYLKWAEEEGLGINNSDYIELIQKTI